MSCYCWLFGLLVSCPSPPYLQQQLAAVAAHAAAAQAQQQAHQVQQQQQQQVQQQPVLTQRPNALSPLTASQLVLSRNSAQSTVSFAVVRHKSRRQMRRKFREGGLSSSFLFILICLKDLAGSILICFFLSLFSFSLCFLVPYLFFSLFCLTARRNPSSFTFRSCLYTYFYLLWCTLLLLVFIFLALFSTLFIKFAPLHPALTYKKKHDAHTFYNRSSNTNPYWMICNAIFLFL